MTSSYQPLASDAIDAPVQRRRPSHVVWFSWPGRLSRQEPRFQVSLAKLLLLCINLLLWVLITLGFLATLGFLVPGLGFLAGNWVQSANVTTLVGVAPNQCSSDTGGSCLIMPCRKKRGPTVCQRVGTFKAKCLCQKGYCAAPDGVCHKKEDLPSFLKSVTNDIGCWKNTGGSCQVLDCNKERGPTQCYIGGCYCAQGSCAREDGKCYPEVDESSLVHLGFTIHNVHWPDQKLYVSGCGPNTYNEPAMNAKMDNLIELANSKEDKGKQGKFRFYELTPKGKFRNSACLLQSLAFPECLVVVGKPWQNHGGKNTYANTYESAMDVPIKDILGSLDGIAWQIHKADPERPQQAQIGTTTGLMMYLRTTPISDEPTFDVLFKDAKADDPGSFWITDPPLDG